MRTHYILVRADDNRCEPYISVFHDQEHAFWLFEYECRIRCNCDFCTRFGAPRLYEVELPCTDTLQANVTTHSNGSSTTFPANLTKRLEWDGMVIPDCSDAR